MHPLRLILIEDSENDARLLIRTLTRHGMQVEAQRVETAQELENCLSKSNWDLVISDYQLPHLSGMDALRLVRARDLNIPFIMVSGSTGEDLAVSAMRAGANDFLSKDHMARLTPIIDREMREAANRLVQHAHEDELRRVHMAMSQVPDGILITNTEGTIVYANPAMEKISGYSLGELMGQTPNLFKSGRQDPDFYRGLWETLKAKQIWQGSFVNKRKDGQFWEAEASIAPVLDGKGELVCYVCTQRDVTRERLLQAQLEHSQRLEALGVLSGGIVHDFNNILTPILAHAELGLLSENLDPKHRQNLEVIALSARRAASLTKQVLGFTRQQSLTLQPMEITALLKESIKLLRAAIPTSVQFQVNLEAGKHFVTADPTKFHQILINLCSNAAHAMRQNGGTLSISLHQADLPETPCAMGQCLPPGTYEILDVSDTGEGMDDPTLARAFMPFFSTKAPGEGTGLGLAITLGIIQEMKGSVQVETVRGKGSRFRVLLPFTPPQTSTTPEAPSSIPLGTERILLVDDEAILASSIQNILESLGYRVISFRNSREALARLKADPLAFDLLITDFTMPAMTGLALTREAKTLRAKLPVILMTGVPNLDLSQEAPEVTPDAILAKPFAIHALGEKVREVLDRTHP